MAWVPKNYRKDKNPFKKSSTPGIFTYRGTSMYVYPDTHNKEYKDIGWNQLISPSKSPISGIQDILQNYPAIRIHECVQETKIDTILSAIKSLVNGFKSGQDTYEKAKESGALGKMGQFVAKALSTNSFFKSLIGEKAPKFKCGDMDLDSTALKIVYALQFYLMNREWNNTYEFPYDNSQLYVSNGTDGWKHEESGWGGTSNNSLVGKMLNFFGSQIRIMSEPIWQGTSQDSQTQIQVKVNLFNNTIERAITNYILIQNIMPNNMYLQYGLLQQAPSYYDVHIFGNRRYPLCKANFTCNYKGLLRKIDLKSLTEFTSETPKIGGKKAQAFFGKHHELRIPDTYELDMNFQSMLPDSFNDFLYFWYLDEFNEMKPIEGGVFKEGEPARGIEKIITASKNITETIGDMEVYTAAVLSGTVQGG